MKMTMIASALMASALSTGVLASGALEESADSKALLPTYKAEVNPARFEETERTMKKRGATVNPTDVRMIVPGVDKDSIYTLIGPPHFDEGISRKWNYVLFFPTGNGTERQRCRVEIRFHRPDKSRAVEVQQLVWEDQACADRVAGAQ